MTGVASQTVSDLLENIGQACSEYQDAVLRNLHCDVVECRRDLELSATKAKNVPDEQRGRPRLRRRVDLDRDRRATRSSSRRGSSASARLPIATRSLPTSRHDSRTTGSNSRRMASRITRSLPTRCGATASTSRSSSRSTAHSVRRVPSSGTAPVLALGLTFGSWLATPIPAASRPATSSAKTSAMRMGMRRFTRLTNAFSKKVENHAHTVSLLFHVFSWRITRTLPEHDGWYLSSER